MKTILVVFVSALPRGVESHASSRLLGWEKELEGSPVLDEFPAAPIWTLRGF